MFFIDGEDVCEHHRVKLINSTAEDLFPLGTALDMALGSVQTENFTKLMGLTGPFPPPNEAARVNCFTELQHKNPVSDLICAPALAINVTGGFLYLWVLQRQIASSESQKHEQ